MNFENPYSNYFPQPNFNPYGYRNNQPQNVNQPVGGSFVWVNSRKEAEDYPLNPNGAQMMMNRNEMVFYLKECDGFGMVKSFKEFPYNERINTPQSTVTDEQKSPEYVSREEFAALKAEIEALKSANKKPKGKEDIQREQ